MIILTMLIFSLIVEINSGYTGNSSQSLFENQNFYREKILQVGKDSEGEDYRGKEEFKNLSSRNYPEFSLCRESLLRLQLNPTMVTKIIITYR